VDQYVGEGFEELDERVYYFIKGATEQNFGDYLPEMFCKAFFLHPRVDLEVYRLVGSVITEQWIKRDLRLRNGVVSGRIGYWGCGMRDGSPISPALLAHCLFFGVRGPATRDALGLPADTVLGDPGLLAPLFHETKPHPETAGRSICVRHVHDTRSDAELLEIAGTDLIVSPIIESSEAALREIIDKIASAEFVLTASLHAAIIACAYGTPFCFWDNGHVDIPFKWQDFAGSAGFEARFAGTLDEGRRLFEDSYRPHIAIPPLSGILDVAPFTIRPGMMLKALAHDKIIDGDALAPIAAAFDRLGSNDWSEIRRLQRVSAAQRDERSSPAEAMSRWAGLNARRIKRALRR
jgi:hypothetical protein